MNIKVVPLEMVNAIEQAFQMLCQSENYDEDIKAQNNLWYTIRAANESAYEIVRNQEP